MKRVPWNNLPADGCLRNGVAVMMSNVHTKGWLLMDIGER